MICFFNSLKFFILWGWGKKITDAVIENMFSCRHSGFHVYIGDRIFPDDKAGFGNLARYILPTCFSKEPMVCIPAENSNFSGFGVYRGICSKSVPKMAVQSFPGSQVQLFYSFQGCLSVPGAF